MTNRKKELAKFLCGFEAFHMLFHAYLWLSDTDFTAFGIKATTTWSIAAVVVNGLISVVLGIYGWRASRPRVGAG